VTTAFPLHRYTYEDYVWLEEQSTIRHEFLEGEIVAMAGGTPEHAAMAAEIIRQLGDQLLSGRCRIFTSDLGVRVIATGLATYPDASVVSGPTERDPEKRTNAVNPTVLVEVTSDATEEFDRGEKLEHYNKIPSLRAVAIVAHARKCVELWTRPDAGSEGSWTRTDYESGAHVELGCVGCTLDVDSIYRAAAEPAV